MRAGGPGHPGADLADQRLAPAVFAEDHAVLGLARFQAVAWTIIVLSGLIACAALRAKHQLASPISINIPGELLAAYAGALWSFFAGRAPLNPTPVPPENGFQVSLPVLGESFVWLLGISHAGYLVGKVMPTTPNPATPTPPPAG